MSANNDPIEVTVDKRGNVIILIDRHNLSAAEVLDMAARAMLAAGYDKSQILQAALAYGGRYANKGTAETQTSAKEPVPAAVAPPQAAPEPSKVVAFETPEPSPEKTSILPPPLPETPTTSKEVITTESKDLPAVPSVEETKAPEIQEIAPVTAAAKPEEIPAVAAIVEAKTEAPEAITPAPEPAPVPVAAEKLEPVAVIPSPVAKEVPAPVPVMAAAEVKSEPAAASPPPFEVPPLAKAPAIPLRTPVAPVSVMGTPAAPKENPAAEKPAKSKMDEILEADRKRIQALIAANAGTQTPDQPAAAVPVTPVTPVIPVVAAAPVAPVAPKLVVSPVPVINTAKPLEVEPIKEKAAEKEEWQGQKFDPATSTSMLIPPMPGMSDEDDAAFPPVADKPLSPPPLPKKPVSVVTPAMMARPITAEVAPTPPANVPSPPMGGPVTMLSRITGFVKLNTIAIPHYQAEAVESTINTPKPVTPSVLSPQPPPTPAKR